MYKTFVESDIQARSDPKPKVAPAPMPAPQPVPQLAAAPRPEPKPKPVPAPEPAPKPAAKAQPKPPKEKKRRKHDYYFAPKYQIPGPRATPSWGAWNAEFGWVWGNGMFLGIDAGAGGWWIDNHDHSSNKYRWAQIGGASINYGNVYNLYADLQLVYGISAGNWLLKAGQNRYISDQGYVYDYAYVSEGFAGGPFIKLRWRYVELSYRGLIGWGSKKIGSEDNDKYEDGLRYNTQLFLGFHLATGKRIRYLR
jgi:hypothetical protein